MTLKYVILPEKRVFIEKMEGEITMEGLLRAIAIIWADPDYSSNFGGVLDLRNANLLLNPTEIGELAKMLIADKSAATGRFALLVNKPFETALSMIFETKMKPKQEINVFTEVANAAWFLQLPAEDLLLPEGKNAKVMHLPTKSSKQDSE